MQQHQARFGSPVQFVRSLRGKGVCRAPHTGVPEIVARHTPFPRGPGFAWHRQTLRAGGMAPDEALSRWRHASGCWHSSPSEAAPQ